MKYSKLEPDVSFETMTEDELADFCLQNRNCGSTLSQAKQVEEVDREEYIAYRQRLKELEKQKL